MIRDEALCFAATTFLHFWKEKGIQLRTVPGHAPESNGKAEIILVKLKRMVARTMAGVGIGWKNALAKILCEYRQRMG